MIFIATLGFDEKFALRAILRRGLSNGDKIFVIAPKRDDPRAEKAYTSLKQMIERLAQVKIQRIRIDSENMPKAIAQLRSFLSEIMKSKESVVLNVSGGQRIVIVELLAAALSLGAYDFELEIETEDSSTVVSIPLRIMAKLDTDFTDMKIMEKLYDSPKTLGEISLETKVNRSTVWRRLNKLIELGLVEKSNGKYKLTDIGKSRIYNVE